MTRRLPLPALYLTTFAAALPLAACSRAASDPTPAAPSGPVSQQPINAHSSSSGIIMLSVALNANGMLLHLSGVPAGATLECNLDSQTLAPCKDGNEYGTPAPGTHKVTALALINGNVAALGESAPFTVGTAPAGTATSSGTGTATAAAPSGSANGGGPSAALALVADNTKFNNGMTAAMSKDFVVPFKFATAPSCAQPQILCNYGSRNSQFWAACDQATQGYSQSFTVGKDSLAQGLQYLQVQASCGTTQGPILTLFWYGVPDGYQPLALKDLNDNNGRHVVNLIKGDDCPESQQQFQCAATAGDAFTPCTNGNVIDQPVHGYRVRVACGTQVGPTLTLTGN